MFSSIRQSTQRVRLWLITAAAILALTSVLEAGHVHGVFTQTDDQCTLCQHSVSLDKPLSSSLVVFIPLLLSIAFSSALILFIPQSTSCFALIRAPPVQLHTR